MEFTNISKGSTLNPKLIPHPSFKGQFGDESVESEGVYPAAFVSKSQVLDPSDLDEAAVVAGPPPPSGSNIKHSLDDPEFGLSEFYECSTYDYDLNPFFEY